MAVLSSPVSLARETLRIVTENKHYNQAIWLAGKYFPAGTVEAYGTGLRKTLAANVCGTTGCVAGNVVVLSLPAKAKYDYTTDMITFPDGREQDVLEYAQDKLDLTYEEANWLFEAGRSLEEVKRALQAIIDGDRVSNVMDAYDW